MQDQQGFTLLEVLLVVVIIALSASLVTQTIPISNDKHVSEEASRFFERLKLLSDDAMLQGENYGVRIDEDEKRIVYLRFDAEGWHQMEEVKQFTTTELEEEVTLSLEVGASVWQNDERFLPMDSLFDDEFDLESSFDEEEEKPPEPPDIYVLSSGELTPFTLTFELESSTQNEDNWRVSVSDVGEIKILSPGQMDEENDQ